MRSLPQMCALTLQLIPLLRFNCTQSTDAKVWEGWEWKNQEEDLAMRCMVKVQDLLNFLSSAFLTDLRIPWTQDLK
jgi:hypothetical protein